MPPETTKDCHCPQGQSANRQPTHSGWKHLHGSKADYLNTLVPLMKTKLLHDRSFSTVAFLLFLAGFASITAAGGQDLYPTTAEEAIAYFEGQVDEWLRGPVDFIILDDERDQWKELETTEQRRAFIDWFWARRDVDLRDSRNPFKLSFYERVATANQRFRGFPRGWKSDRGLVWVIIDRPDAMGRRTSAQDRISRFGPTTRQPETSASPRE